MWNFVVQNQIKNIYTKIIIRIDPNVQRPLILSFSVVKLHIHQSNSHICQTTTNLVIRQTKFKHHPSLESVIQVSGTQIAALCHLDTTII